MESSREKINKWIRAALLIIWPFVFLFPYVVPINGKYLLIGSDFNYLYYKYKVYFLALINSSHFPLWSPSEASGYPFFSSPFGQAFYPLNAPLALFYRITGGLSVLDYQRFSVLGISIFALGTYLWLRSLNIKPKPALLAVLIISVSFKMVNDIRFPNAVHSACWYPWILYAITKIGSSKTRKPAILYGALLIFSSFSLITAGYPYYLYYSLFLIIPYGILTLIPSMRERVFHLSPGNLRRTWVTYTVSGVVLILITVPYLVQLFSLLQQTFTRSGGSWAWSIFRLFGPVDSLGSLVYPIGSYDEGWYFFGFIGLLLILIFLLGKVNSGSVHTIFSRFTPTTKVLLVVWFLIISYISWGKDSLLFAFLWRFLPGFSSLRQWGRLNIILLPIFAWLLALSIQYFEELLSNSKKPSSLSRIAVRRAIWVLIGAYVAVLGIQVVYILEHYYNFYWTYYFIPHFMNFLSWPFQANGWPIPSLMNIHHFFMFLFVFFGFISFLVCLFLLLRARTSKPYSATLIFIVFLFISGLSELTTGPWMWTQGWDNLQTRSNLNIASVDVSSFNTPRANIYDSLSLNSVFNSGTFNDWYYSRYISFLARASTEPGAEDILLGRVNGQKIFFSTSINPVSLQAFVNTSSKFQQVAQVDTYNGDSLKLTVDAPENGFISFIDNWDPNWRASIDGHPVQIELLFGTFKSVKISAGSHGVVFAYCPSVFKLLNQACATMK